MFDQGDRLAIACLDASVKELEGALAIERTKVRRLEDELAIERTRVRRLEDELRFHIRRKTTDWRLSDGH
tara:strand:- start:666 stop:875 length:210 start_codon:yes stop_codon:yes gene_type:complete